MKKNIVFIIVFGALLIGISVVLILINKNKDKQNESSDLANLPRVKLFSIEDESSANKFELNYSNITIIIEKDAAGSWNITEPNRMMADQLESLANVKNFNTLIFETRITNMNDREIFGIDDPVEEYSIWENDKIHTIYVGNKTLDDLGYYVKYNDEVFKLEQIYIMALRKSIKDLREKDFLKMNSESVVIVDIDNKVLLRNYLDGRISANGDEDIEGIKANIAFTLFSTLEAIDFINESSSPKDYGFDDNPKKITLQLDDNSDISYYLSKVDVNVYAKMENSDLIYEVNPNVYNNDWYNLEYYKEESSEDENMRLSRVLSPLSFEPFKNLGDTE